MSLRHLLTALTTLAALVLPAAATITPTHWYRMGEGDPSATAGGAVAALHDALGGPDLTFTGATSATAAFSADVPPATAVGVTSRLCLSLPAGSAAAQGPAATGSTSYGFELWMKPLAASLTGTHCVFYNGTPGASGCGLYLVDGKYTVRAASATYGAFTLTSSATVAANAWTNMTVVVTPGRISLYKNGSILTTNASALPDAPAGTLTLGAAPAATGATGLTQFFAGALDEVRSFTVTGSFSPTTDLLAASPQIQVAASYSGPALVNGAPYAMTPTATGSYAYAFLYAQAVTVYSSLYHPDLEISSVTLSGPDAAEFQLSGADFLPASSIVDLTLSIYPTTPGIKTATLTIVSNDPDDNPFIVPISLTVAPAPNIAVYAGAGTDPEARYYPVSPPLSFRGSAPGASGEEKTLTILNDGLADMHLARLSIAGTDAQDFSIGSAPASLTLAPGASTSFTVKFNPTAAGERYGSLLISSDAADKPAFYINLSGAGDGPLLGLAGPDGAALHSGAELGWGEDYDASTPSAGLGRITALANGGDFMAAVRGDGTVAVWDDLGQGLGHIPAGLHGVTAVAAGWSHVAALKSDGTVVAWGAAPEANVPGGLTGVVAIAADDYCTIALKSDGTVVTWGESFFTSNLPAGLTGVTAIAAGSEVALALKSDGTVVEWGWSASVPPPPALHARVITAGDTWGAATVNDTLVILWDMANSPPPRPISTAPVIALSGRGDELVATGSDGSITVASSHNFYGELDIPAGAPRFVTTAQAGNERFDVIYDSLLDFSALDPGHSGAPQTLTLTNAGSATLHLGGVTLGGAGASRYVLNASALPATLAPGASATLTVAASPAATGPDGATLQILSDSAASSLFTVRLAGAPPATVNTPYQTWKLAYFGTAAETGDSADNADPNHNGIPNLLEYALGNNPLAAATGIAMPLTYAVDSTGTSLTLTFMQSSSAYDAILTLQICNSHDASGQPVWTDIAESDNGNYPYIFPPFRSVYQMTNDYANPRTVTVTVPLSSASLGLFRLAARR